MGFLTALLDATPLAVVVAIAAVWAANVSGSLLPLLVGPLAGLAVLASGTMLSLRFQTDERQFPVLRVSFELLTFW
jgi:hypothetical protein